MKRYVKITCLVLIVIIVSFIIYRTVSITEMEKVLKKQGFIDIILLGIDDLEGLSRADTIIIARLSRNGDIRVLHFPRDTRVSYLGSYQKINTIFARGKLRKDEKEGYERLKEILKNEYSIELLRYFIMDYKVFSQIIDIIGGVEVYASRNLHYVDVRGNLYIDITKGVNHFDGLRALEYVRYRDGLGDIGRIERQKDFIHSLMKADNITRMLKNPKVIRLLFSRLNTNITLKELMYLKKTFGIPDLNRLKLATLPGIPDSRGHYWISDYRGFDDLFTTKDIPERIVVEVLNGNGVAGIGQKMAAELRKLGYDVVSIGNADRRDYERTVVLNFTGDYQAVRKMVEMFNIGLIYNRDKKGVYDVQIIIGKDILDIN